MNQKNLFPLILIAIIAGVAAFIISGLVFKPLSHNNNAPAVVPISADFPDVKNDSKYSSIFYEGALDPTQPVHIGSSSNKAPFNGQ